MATKYERGKVRATMQVIVSLLVLLAALYIILSSAFHESYAKWAFGIIGVIVGYWLK